MGEARRRCDCAMRSLHAMQRAERRHVRIYSGAFQLCPARCCRSFLEQAHSVEQRP